MKTIALILLLLASPVMAGEIMEIPYEDWKTEVHPPYSWSVPQGQITWTGLNIILPLHIKDWPDVSQDMVVEIGLRDDGVMVWRNK